MTTQDFILLTVQADAPCTYLHIIHECKKQGFTKGMIQAFNVLKSSGLVLVSEDEENALIVDLA